MPHRNRPFLPALVLTSLFGSEATAAPDLSVGQPFPSTVLPSLHDGAPLSIEAFRGRSVLMQIWASW